MRRLLVAGVAALVMGAAVSASAGAVDYYKDRFTSIGWGGSDGSLHWSGPWAEINDDGDAKKGSVRVVSSGQCASGNCMRIAGLLAGIGASRIADTSDLEELSFSYDLKNVRTLPLLSLTKLVVEARDGGEWVEIAEHDLGDGFSSRFTLDDLDGFSSDDFGIRFTVVGAAMTSEVYIDNVEVQGVPAEAPVTTSTTTTTVAEVTTTTAAVTTTTIPSTTTTTVPNTSTSRPEEASTTTQQPAGSSTSTTAKSTTDENRDDLTPTSSSTTAPPSTTTSIPRSTSGFSSPSETSEPGSPGGSGAIPDGSGIRAAARGIQANFQGDLFGEARTVSSLGGVDLQAEYTIAAEVIRSSWAWMVVLGLVIAWAIVSGLDRRRPDIDG